jgi:hypothetical protein
VVNTSRQSRPGAGLEGPGHGLHDGFGVRGRLLVADLVDGAGHPRHDRAGYRPEMIADRGCGRGTIDEDPLGSQPVRASIVALISATDGGARSAQLPQPPPSPTPSHHRPRPAG